MLNCLFGVSVGPLRHRNAVRTADMGQLSVFLSHPKWKKKCASVCNCLHTLCFWAQFYMDSIIMKWNRKGFPWMKQRIIQTSEWISLGQVVECNHAEVNGHVVQCWTTTAAQVDCSAHLAPIQSTLTTLVLAVILTPLFWNKASDFHGCFIHRTFGEPFCFHIFHKLQACTVSLLNYYNTDVSCQSE